jgi:hypothetical protein
MSDLQPTASSPQPAPPIHFAGKQLGAKRHICAFFRSPEEEYRVLLPFIKEGFERGEKAFHVVDPKLYDDHKRRLETAGIDVAAAAGSGQFTLCNWNEAYFPDGRFDFHRMLDMWQDVLDTAGLHGFPRTRLVAHMEWSLEDREGVTDLIEYEASFNLIHDDRDPVICTYDLNKYSGSVVMDILRTHPTIIVGGILQESPFYIPAERFLAELRERRADQRASTGVMT